MIENAYLALDRTELTVLIDYYARECRRLQHHKDQDSLDAWGRAYLRAEYLTALLPDRARIPEFAA